MANKGDIYKVALPNGDEYNFKDKYVRENYRALNNNDFDTINVTELNSGNIINTGAARFLNPINGVCTDGTSETTKYMRQDGTWAVPPNDNTDTWRNIKVNTTEKLSTAISSGSVDFTDGNHINISFNETGNKLTIAHADTSTQASVSNSGRTYIQSISLDGDGHVTGISSATETVTDTNTWRNIKINGTEKLTTAISSGAVDFINGTNTTVSFNATGNKVQIDAVDTKYALDISGNNVILKKDGTTQDTITVPYATSAGTATSANKLTTARTITLAGDLIGSASFDGSGDITIKGHNYYNLCGSSNRANYPYHRIAHYEGTPGASADITCVLEIRSYYNGGPYGKVLIAGRTSGSAGGGITITARWLYRYGFELDDLQIAYIGSTGNPSNIDVFLKCSTYARKIVYQLYGDRVYTLIASYEAKNTTASDPLTSYECYKTIADAATALYESTYANIVSSADCATVNYANSAGSATQDGAGNTITSTYLPLAGGTMTGQLYTSFKSAVAMGSRQSDATTIDDLVADVRYSSGCMGSVSIGTAYTKNGVTIPTGWYNYEWIPHRSGGENGSASGDNCNYGVLYLSHMTSPGQGTYEISFASSAIAQVRMMTSFTTAPTTGQVVISDGTHGGVKTSGYTIATSVPSGAVFTDTDHTYNLTSTNDSLQIATGTSGDNTIWDVSVVKVNGHTVNEDVPSDAIFTDQYVSQSATSANKWRKILLSYQADTTEETAVTANTNVVYETPKAEINPSTGSIRSAGNITAAIFGVSAKDGTSGGISLYSGAGNVDNYGIAFRKTTDKEKHGYVQSDWATYFTMNSGATTRGWVYRLNQTDGNVASISGAGNLVLNGSVTIGGNTTNTSGARMQYNASTNAIDFVFVT